MTNAAQYWPHGRIATLALQLIWISIPLLVIQAFLLFRRLGQLRRCADILRLYLQSSDSFMARARLDTGALTNNAASRLRAVAWALETESQNSSTFNSASMVRHVLILLSDQFSRTAHRLISLGWAVILVAGTGTLADITQAFRGLSLLGEEPNIRAWAMVVADTIPILGLGFIVGFACIGIAGYFQGRLEHLIRDVVYAVLASAPKKEPSVKPEDLPNSRR